MMKKLDEYINESIELGPGTIASIFLAACFCIPNGVSAVVQLIKNHGKREAAKELISQLDQNQKKYIKNLGKLDLDKFPHTKELLERILSGQSTEAVMNQYWIVIHSNEINNPIILKNAEHITRDYMDNIRAHRNKKIKWAVDPSTFFSMMNFSKIFLRK